MSDRLKRFSASEADVELRTLSPEAGGTVMLMLNFMKMLAAILKTGRNYELTQAYMSLYLKVSLCYEQQLSSVIKPCIHNVKKWPNFL